MATYSAPLVLQNIHAFRRFDITNTNSQVGNDFQPDFTTSAGKTYVSSVMSLGGIFFAFGGLSFLGFIAANIVAACCCKPKEGRNKREGCFGAMCGFLFSPRLWWIASVVFMLAGTSAALSQIDLFRQSIVDTTAALNSLDSLLRGTTSLISVNLMSPLNNASSTATAFYNAAVTNNAPADVLASIVSLQTFISSAQGSATASATQLNNTVNTLTSRLQAGGQQDVQRAGHTVFVVGVSVLACFLGWILSTVVTLIGNKCCARTFRVCNAFVVMAVGGIFLFAGVFLVVSLVGSDICVDPSTAIQRIANVTNATSEATATLSFYTTCLPNVTYTADMVGQSAYGQLLNGEAQVVNATTNVQSWLNQVGTYPWASPFVYPLSDQMTAVNASVYAIAASVSCAPINSIYVSLLNALCGKGIVGVAVIWSLSTAACLLIFTIASAGVSLCASHPGDEEDSINGLLPSYVSTMPAAINASSVPGTYGGSNSRGAPAAYGNASAYGGARDW